MNTILIEYIELVDNYFIFFSESQLVKQILDSKYMFRYEDIRHTSEFVLILNMPPSLLEILNKDDDDILTAYFRSFPYPLPPNSNLIVRKKTV